jgi:lactate permease
MAEEIIMIFSNSQMLWPIVAPFVGMFGAFISGSSTVSNLMFSSIQLKGAIAIGMSPIIGLVLQAVGSSVGNVLSIHNVIAASSVVGLNHKDEGKVIRYTFLPAVLYCLSAGIVGYIMWQIL